ncbi:MAG: hypothetical protein MUF34_19900 [Polyangiaceae bacterium]|nr:hypothetical protein [Polyangiaceae bacterium]
MTPYDAPPPRRRRVLTFVLVGLGCTLLGAGVVGYLRLPGLVKAYAEEKALERGVALHVDDVDLSFDWVRLRGVTFSPLGVAGVKGRADRVTVDLKGLEPTRVTTRSASVELEGSLGHLAAELDAWSKRYPAAARPPVAADGVTLAWRQTPGESPWLEATNASAQADPNGGSFYAPTATLFGVSAGELSLGWWAGRDDLLAGLGHRDPNNAPLRLEVRPGPPLQARLRVVSTPLPSLGALLGMRINEPGISAEATADLVLTPGPERDTIAGHTELTLHGYVPPRPRELQGARHRLRQLDPVHHGVPALRRSPHGRPLRNHAQGRRPLPARQGLGRTLRRRRQGEARSRRPRPLHRPRPLRRHRQPRQPARRSHR